jgi:hypothetical protein
MIRRLDSLEDLNLASWLLSGGPEKGLKRSLDFQNAGSLARKSNAWELTFAMLIS